MSEVDLEKLKFEIFKAVRDYFGAASDGPRFIRRINEVFERTKAALKKEEDNGHSETEGKS